MIFKLEDSQRRKIEAEIKQYSGMDDTSVLVAIPDRVLFRMYSIFSPLSYSQRAIRYGVSKKHAVRIAYDMRKEGILESKRKRKEDF